MSGLRRRDFHRFRDRHAEAAVAVGITRQHVAAVVGERRGTGDARRAVGLHQRPPVGLLVVRHAHHEDLHLDAEERAGKRERRAPLAGAGLGGDLADAGFAVVERLGHRRVRLVTAGRTDALVLVVDARRRLQGLLEAAGAEQRRRTPLAVHVAHRPGNLDLALGRDLLLDQRHREQRREIVRAERLQRARMQGRRARRRQVGGEVVPGGRQPGLVEQVLHAIGHASSVDRRPSYSRARL